MQEVSGANVACEIFKIRFRTAVKFVLARPKANKEVNTARVVRHTFKIRFRTRLKIAFVRIQSQQADQKNSSVARKFFKIRFRATEEEIR